MPLRIEQRCMECLRMLPRTEDYFTLYRTDDTTGFPKRIRWSRVCHDCAAAGAREHVDPEEPSLEQEIGGSNAASS